MQAKEDSTVYNILVTPSKLILRQTNEILVIEIPIRKANTNKKSTHSEDTTDKIQVRDISIYQLSEEQLDNSAMQDIEQQITSLLDKFNKNKLAFSTKWVLIYLLCSFIDNLL